MKKYMANLADLQCVGRPVEIRSVQSCATLCSSVDCSTLGLPVHHQLLEPIQTHVHWVGDDIQPSHPLSSPFPPALNLSQHQGLLQWDSSLHQVAKVLEFQLQHQSFQWTHTTKYKINKDLLYSTRNYIQHLTIPILLKRIWKIIYV